MLAALGVTLVVGVAGLFVAMPRLAAASARA
jgi:hypothetical protein